MGGGSVVGAGVSGLGEAGVSLGCVEIGLFFALVSASEGFVLFLAFVGAVTTWSFAAWRAGLPSLALVTVRAVDLFLATLGLLSAGGAWGSGSGSWPQPRKTRSSPEETTKHTIGTMNTRRMKWSPWMNGRMSKATERRGDMMPTLPLWACSGKSVNARTDGGQHLGDGTA